MILDAHRCCRYNSYLSACMLGIHLQIPQPQNWCPMLGEHGGNTLSANRRFMTFWCFGEPPFASFKHHLVYKLLWENPCKQTESNIHLPSNKSQIKHILDTNTNSISGTWKDVRIQIWAYSNLMDHWSRFPVLQLPGYPALQRSHPAKLGHWWFSSSWHEKLLTCPPMLPMFPGKYYVSSWFLFICHWSNSFLPAS